MKPPGKVMAVDPGERRVGFAISDPDRKFAFPLKKLERSTQVRDEAFILALVREEEPVLLVMGLPLRGLGEEGESARRARAFGDWVADVTGLPMVYFNESYTTKIAEGLLWSAGLSHAERKSRRDALAAQVLLTTWIEAGCPEVRES